MKGGAEERTEGIGCSLAWDSCWPWVDLQNLKNKREKGVITRVSSGSGKMHPCY